MQLLCPFCVTDHFVIASEFHSNIPPPQVPQPYEEPLSVKGTLQERRSVSSNSAFGITELLTTPSLRVQSFSENTPTCTSQDYEDIPDDTKADSAHGYNRCQNEQYAQLADAAVYSEVGEEADAPPPNIQALYAIVNKTVS